MQKDPGIMQGSTRLAIGVAALALLWVIVYWWTPAGSPRPSIAFQNPPSPPEEQEMTTSAAPPALTTPARPAGAIIPPTFYQHTVVRGDTAETISRQYYGTARHWRAVMHANPKTDFQHLRPGLVVRVPVDPANIQGKPATESAATTGGAEPVRGFEYVVQKGDTLSELAQRFYGRATAWGWIVDANRQSLGDDGRKLRAGMTIIIPPAPEPTKPQ